LVFVPFWAALAAAFGLLAFVTYRVRHELLVQLQGTAIISIDRQSKNVDLILTIFTVEIFGFALAAAAALFSAFQ
jgi:hypothetical protein